MYSNFSWALTSPLFFSSHRVKRWGFFSRTGFAPGLGGPKSWVCAKKMGEVDSCLPSQQKTKTWYHPENDDVKKNSFCRDPFFRWTMFFRWIMFQSAKKKNIYIYTFTMTFLGCMFLGGAPKLHIHGIASPSFGNNNYQHPCSTLSMTAVTRSNIEGTQHIFFCKRSIIQCTCIQAMRGWFSGLSSFFWGPDAWDTFSSQFLVCRFFKC